MPRELAPILKTLLFTVVVPGSVTVLVPYYWVLQRHPRAVFDALGVLGIALLATGAATYLYCAWNFAYHGLGTPAPIDPPKVLVSGGLHRLIRNPMYVGVLGVVLGEAALFHSRNLLIYGGCFGLASHLFVVLYEEPTLRKQFGASYDEYCARVPRWIPRFRSRRPGH